VYARVWWLRTVFRWLHPIGDDYANPNVPVLHGAGGLGKTTFCRDISGTFPERAPDTIFFLKTQIGGETKSVFEKFKGKLVVEYEELVVNGSDAVRKAFTGGGSQTFREAYARSAKVHHVIAAQIGTTNEHKFIQSNDVENERRFLPVLVTKKYMENRIKYDEWKQLVAEAMVAINDCVPPMDITMFEGDIVESHRKNVDSCRSVKVLRQESDEELREENLAVYRQFYLNYLRNLWFAPHGNGGPPKPRSKVRVADLRKAAMDEFKTNAIAPCATALRGTPGIVVRKWPEFSAAYVVPEDGERPPWTYPDGTHGAEIE
ncbi:MAG: VapE domain-containing protein, partial [Giesbergeria sp.]